MAKRARTGTKAELKAFTTGIIDDRIMKSSDRMTINQALMLQNSINRIFTSKNEFLEVPLNKTRLLGERKFKYFNTRVVSSIIYF